MPSPPATTMRSTAPAAMAARPCSSRTAGVGRAEVEDVDPRGTQQGQGLGADPGPGVLARGRVDDETQARHAGMRGGYRPALGASWERCHHGAARSNVELTSGAGRHSSCSSRCCSRSVRRSATCGSPGCASGRPPCSSRRSASRPGPRHRRRARDPRGRRHLRARAVHLHRRRRLRHPLLRLAAPGLAHDARRGRGAGPRRGPRRGARAGPGPRVRAPWPGAYAGALTNTPALAAASARAADPAAPTIGYSITYLGGVVVMLAVAAWSLRRPGARPASRGDRPPHGARRGARADDRVDADRCQRPADRGLTAQARPRRRTRPSCPREPRRSATTTW